MEFIRHSHEEFDYVEVKFSMSEPLIEKAKHQAKSKTPFTHQASPSAKKRSVEEVFNAQLLGTIADIAFCNLLQSFLDKYHPTSFTVERYDDIREDNFENPDQFDARILNNQEQVLAEIEIRSSVANRIPFEGILRSWHILGWYTTQNKPAEPIRNYYVHPIYHYKLFNTSQKYELADAHDHLEQNNLALFIVGGASADMLQNIGYVQRKFGLLQEGASYQLIDIRKALGMGDLLSSISNFVTP